MMCSTITMVIPRPLIRRHQLDRQAHLGRGQAGQRLVKQQQPGFGGERTGDLQPLATGRSQASGQASPRGGTGR